LLNHAIFRHNPIFCLRVQYFGDRNFAA
jgi:hypothetical protein